MTPHGTELLNRTHFIAYLCVFKQSLEAIREANHLFFEISPQPCPICGADGKPIEGISSEQIDEACAQEIQKIQILLNDLSQTSSQLSDEQKHLESQRAPQQVRFISSSNHIQQVLIPTAKQSQSDIEELLGTRGKLEKVQQLINQLTLLKEKQTVLAKPEPKRPKLKNITAVLTLETKNLCDQIKILLDAWNYPDAGPVSFSELDQDILIADRQRRSPGKGFRAISYAAFSIGLMKSCRKAKLPHPGFVVLDSPLVAYKHPRELPAAIKSSNVKDAFYRFLAKTSPEEQIIVIENEDPPLDISAKINHVQFTRDVNDGRYGFFPLG